MRWKFLVIFLVLTTLILYLDFQEQDFLLTDLGKDILVAKHLAYGFTDTVFIRPNSTWAELPLTPLYFWLMALLYAVVRSPFGMTIGMVVVKFMMLFVLFFLGRSIKNARLGIVFLIIVGTSQYYLLLHLNPYLFTTLFFLLGLYTYTRATKREKMRELWLFASIFCVFLTIGMHISALVMLPSFLFLWVRDMTWITGKQRCGMLSFIIFMFLLLIILMYYGRIEISAVTIMNVLPDMLSHMDISTHGQTLFSFISRSSPLVILFIIPATTYLIRVKNAHERTTFLAIMGSLGLFFMIPFSQTRPLRLEYIGLPLLGCMLGIAYWLDSMAKAKTTFRMGAAVVTGILVLGSLNTVIHLPTEKRGIHTYKDSREIAMMITGDKEYSVNRKLKIFLPFYGFGTLPNISDYFSGGVWYAMEEVVGRRLLMVVDANDPKQSNNIAHNDMFDYILICVEDEIFNQENCVSDFRKNYTKDHLTRIGQHKNYTIYKSY